MIKSVFLLYSSKERQGCQHSYDEAIKQYQVHNDTTIEETIEEKREVELLGRASLDYSLQVVRLPPSPSRIVSALARSSAASSVSPHFCPVVCSLQLISYSLALRLCQCLFLSRQLEDKTIAAPITRVTGSIAAVAVLVFLFLFLLRFVVLIFLTITLATDPL